MREGGFAWPRLSVPPPREGEAGVVRLASACRPAAPRARGGGFGCVIALGIGLTCTVQALQWHNILVARKGTSCGDAFRTAYERSQFGHARYA